MSSGPAVADSERAVAGSDDSELARATMRRVSLRLLPFIFVLYVVNFLDRTNLALAALEMNRDLRFSATVYGFGVGVFFFGYAFFEIPSNLALAHIGARRWIARIMITWGLIASGMMFVRTPVQFYVVRFLLGAAEAGFFPGIVYYLSEWFPAAQRGRAMSQFMAALPISGFIGGPLSGWILGFDGRLGLRGWQWVFLLEGIPAVLLGVVALGYLTDRVEDARWLSDGERAWLGAQLRREEQPNGGSEAIHEPLRAIAHPGVWVLSLIYLVFVTAGYVQIFWAPLVIRDSLHSSNAATGLLVGAIGLASAVAMVVAGASSDRREERFLHSAGAAGLMALGFVGVVALPRSWGPVVALTVSGCGGTVLLPIFWCLPRIILRGRGAAAGIALVSSIGSFGGFIGPYVVGLLKDATGAINGAFLGCAALAAIAGAMLLALRSRGVFAAYARAAAYPAENGASVA